MGLRLVQLIDSPEARVRFRETEQAAIEIKTSFYDQFLPLTAVAAGSGDPSA